MMKRFLSRLRTYFITGLAVILPAFLTLIVLKWLIGKINRWFLEPFAVFVRPYVDSFPVIFLLKLILFFLILLFIILCGAATRLIFINRFFSLGERLLGKTPFVNKIYIAIKEISGVLFSRKKGLFRKVVLIEFPRKGMFAIGFVTCEHIDRSVVAKASDDDYASVFVPTAPNPTTGTLVFVKKGELIDTDISVEEALKLILSGGAVSPYKKK